MTKIQWLLILPLCAGLAMAEVQVQQTKDSNWHLLVDGQSFWIKGVGCNKAVGEKGEDFLRMAKELGANSVRTWGHAPRSYLDQAEAYGLKVDLGVWLNPIRAGMSESYRDPAYCKKERESTMAYIREMKDHPALLLWNIGNEVFTFTEDAEERQAFGTFLEGIIQEIHREDPKHPVIYAAAGTKDLEALQQWIPSLDIVGANTYGGFSSFLGWMRTHAYDKPVIATEFGPQGPWDTRKDKNGVPFDPPDQMKASETQALWRQIEAARGKTLGGYAFVLGEQTNQNSLTWWNMNFGDNRRAAYWAVYSAYTGQKPPQTAPVISEFHVDSSTGLAPGQRIQVRATAKSAGERPLQFAYFITNIHADPLWLAPPVFFPCDVSASSPGLATLRVPQEPGNYRVYVSVFDDRKNVAIANRSIQIIPQSR